MTDKMFGAYFLNANTGAYVTGIDVLADHYSGLVPTLVTANLPTTEAAEMHTVVIDIDTSIPHIVIFHTVDTSVAQQRIATDFEPTVAAVDLTPVLDAIEDVPTAAENAAANWNNATRTLTALPSGATIESALNQRTKRLDIVRGDSYTVGAGTQIPFPWSGWYATADTITVAIEHIQTGTIDTFTGAMGSDRNAYLELTSEETDALLVGEYRYDVQLINGDDVHTPYNKQKWVVAKDLASP